MSMKPGQAIVEAIMAFGLVLLVIVGLVELSKKSVSNSGLSQREAVANNYLNQAMDWIRAQRRDSWGNISSLSGVYCLSSYDSFNWSTQPNGGNLDNCARLTGSNGETEFIRGVTVTLATVTPDPSGTAVEQVTVIGEVRWREGERVVRRRQVTTFSAY